MTAIEIGTRKLNDVAKTCKDPGERAILLQTSEQLKIATISNAILSGTVRWECPLSVERGYGPNLDERVVELPLAAEVCREALLVLDAGGALDKEWLKSFIGHASTRMVHYTQAPENRSFATNGARFSCMYGDLRNLEFRDAVFDAVVCISTLEHVGMDNRHYGGDAEHDPDGAYQVVGELTRVLKPGGTMLITVPYGQSADHGTFRVFGADDLNRLTGCLGHGETRLRWYRYDGWWSDGDDVQETDAPVSCIAAIRWVKRGAD